MFYIFFYASYVYPSMDELAETLTAVKDHVGFRSFIGFGVGLGANVLVRYALKHPDDVSNFYAVTIFFT